MASGEVFQVWTDSGAAWGTFELERVDFDVRWTLAEGQMVALACDLTLRDPGDVEADTPEPAAIAGNATDTTTEPIPEDRTITLDEVTIEGIARR